MQSDRTIHVRYDAGTLLVDGPAGVTVAGARWDPRGGAPRARACDRALVLESLRLQGCAVVDRTPPTGRVAGIRSPELRPYQEAAVRAWDLGGRRGVVVLPTGAGKTRVALGAM